MAVDRIIHTHLASLYQFVCLTFPLADVDEIIDLTFRRAEIEVPPASRDHERWWLCGLARRVVAERHPGQRWERKNAAAIVDGLRDTAKSSGDGNLLTEVHRITRALETLPINQQLLLRLVQTVEGVADDGIGLVLGVNSQLAGVMVSEASNSFRRAYENAGGRKEGR